MMFMLSLFLFLASILALFVGLIKPSIVLWWFSGNKDKRTNVLVIYGVAIVIFFVSTSLFAVSEEDTEYTTTDTTEEYSSLEEDIVVEEKQVQTQAEVVVEPVEPELTLSQEQAIKTAESYLDYAPFSESGLIGQLEYEGFSNEDATFAVQSLGVNWKEQAVYHAKSYLEYDSFSRNGLIEQLEYEGYSNEDATYAVDQIGL